MKKTVTILVFLTLASIVCRAQNVTIHKKNASWQVILEEVERQTSYNIFMTTAVLQNKRDTDVNVINKPAFDFLESYLSDIPCMVNQIGNLIYITARDKPISLPIEITIKINVKARIINKDGNGIPGANIKVVKINKGTSSDDSGYFELNGIDENAILEITYVGYKTKTVKASGINNKNIELEIAANELTSLSIVANGYQSFPKERSAASYVFIDSNKINRNTSPYILNRLLGVTSGLLSSTNPDDANNMILSIRGISTINANATPLIVVDGFVFSGDISSINPNNVENITILKDGAAASIYGARSGNGVIVITTKKGKIKNAMRVTLNTNTTFGEKPNLFRSKSYIDSRTLVDLEAYLYKNNYSRHFTPVTDILLKRDQGTLSDTQATNELDALKENDIRNDLGKYFYEKSVNQQYAININGGNTANTYSLTAGFDHNKPNLTYNEFQRYTINSYNTFTLLKNLELQVGFNYAETRTKTNNGGKDSISQDNFQLPTYIQLVDKDGTPLPVTSDLEYMMRTSNPKPAMDWNIYPYDEIRKANNVNRLSDLWLDARLLYKLGYGLSFETDLQYLKQDIINRNQRDENTYYTRNLINLFYNPTAASDILKFPVPVGDILDKKNYFTRSYHARSQINFNQTFENIHSITAMLAAEGAKTITDFDAIREYGYHTTTNTGNSLVDYQNLKPTFKNLAESLYIPHADAPYTAVDESTSFFANASYTYKNKYNIYGSCRFDEYNIYGANTNKKWLPLWSVASYWKISNENFLDIPWITNLKLKASYSLTGNANLDISALQTINISAHPNNFGYYSSYPNNPPNPDLGCEISDLSNFGLDFILLKGRINGSVEYYIRNGKNLIGTKTLAPSIGLSVLDIPGYYINNAKMNAHGIDINIISKNIDTKNFKWSTEWLFSVNKDKIVSYDQTFLSLAVVQASGGLHNMKTPVVGKPSSAIFSYRWADLDPSNGNPQGYTQNGKISTNYDSLLGVPVNELVFNGPATPVIWGSVLNTISFKKLSLSLNVTYKMDYYGRASTFSSYALVNSGVMHSDYYKVWTPSNPNTHVPSADYSVNSSSRDDFYAYSSVNVFNASHFRLQDITLRYDINDMKLGPAKVGLQVYMYLNNLGIIWRANKYDIDPDAAAGNPIPKTLAAGFKLFI